MADQGFRIPIELDFTRSIQNVQQFRAHIRQALWVDPSTVPAGTTPRQITGQLGSAAGQLRAAVETSVLGPSDKTRLLGIIEREVAASARQISRQLFGDEQVVRVPSQREIERFQATAMRRIQAASEREAVAAGKAAQAAEQRAAAQQEATRQARTGRAAGVSLFVPDGVPSTRRLQQMKDWLESSGPASVIPRLAAAHAYRDRFRSQVGIASETHPEFRDEESTSLRLAFQMARLARQMEERILLAEAVTRNDRDLLDETGRLRVALRQRELAERAAAREAAQDSPELLRAQAADQIARERERAQQAVHVEALTTPDDINTAVAGRAAQQRRAAVINAGTNEFLAEDRAHIEASARVRRAQQARARQVEQILGQERAASAQGTTFFQRMQMALAARRGVPVADASSYQTGTQFFQSRFLTTAGFAASGAILYGGIRAVRELITEATELQQQMAILEAQYENAGSAGVESFSQVREEIFRISRDTGIMANEVADVTRQLAGVFSDPETGTPDFGRALDEAETAFQLAQVTGLAFQEITDSLSAVALAFPDDDFESIADTIVGLEQQFGVLAPEIVKFTADLAPLGSALGFTNEQLSALGAVAQKASGRSGGVLAEQFGRILPELTSNAAELIALFQTPATESLVSTLVEDLAENDVPGVLRTLVQGYEMFGAAQRNQLATLLGGRREAASLFAVLERGTEVMRVLGEDADLAFSGALEQRFERFQKTVTFAFQQMQRSIEEFGLTLFEAGIADALVNIANAGRIASDVLRVMLDLFVKLDDAAGGSLTTLLGITAAMYGAARAMRFVGGLRNVVTTAMAWGRGVPGTQGAYALPPPMAVGPTSPITNPARSALFAGSRFGAVRGVGALVSANAPLLAAGAAVLAFSLRESMKDDLSGAYAELVSTAKQALLDGADPDEIIRIAREEGDKNLSLGERAALRISGVGLPSDAVTDAVQEHLGDLYAEQIRALLADSSLFEDGPVRITGPTIDYLDVTGEQVKKFLEEYEKNPSKNINFEIAQAILRAASLDPRLAGLLAEQEKEWQQTVNRQAQASRALEFLGDVEGALDFERLRSEVEAGRGSLDDYQHALQLRIDATRAVLDDLIAKNAKTELIVQQQELLSSLEREMATIAERRLGLVDTLRRIVAAAGTDTPEVSIDLAQLRLTMSETPADKFESALQVIQAAREAFEARLAEVDDAVERARLAEEGFEIPVEATRALVEGFLTDQGVKARLGQLAAALSLGLNGLSSLLAQAISEGKAAGDLIQEYRQGLADQVNKALQVMAPGGDYSSFYRFFDEIPRSNELGERQQAAIDELNRISEILGQSFGPTIKPPKAVQAPKAPTGPKTDPRDLQRRIEEARIAVERARANGDPVELARLAIQSAEVAQRYAKDEAERLQAFAQVIEARNQLRDAELERNAAWVDAALTMTGDNAVDQARYQLGAARIAVQQAKGDAARARALAQEFVAKRALRDAIRDVTNSQIELLAAVANAAGDTVEAARQQLRLAQNALARLQAEGGGKAEINRAKAEIVNAEAAVRDARFQDQLGDVDFLLEMERISVQQAISMLERIATIPGLTEEHLRTIERRIRQLREEVNQNLQFNLPDIQLPTLYEVRRLMQSGTPAGTGTYQTYNNNQVTFGDIIITNEVDSQAFLERLGEMLDAPPTSGFYAGIY